MKIAERVICGLLVLVMLVTLFVIVTPRLLGWRFEAILSGSMSPALETGDLVVVLPVNSDVVQQGDIIAYHPPGDTNTLIVHRVVEVEPGNLPRFQTKGDANPSPDAYLVSGHNVVGRVSLHLPWLGHFTRFAQNTLGFILLLAIPGAIIIASELAKVRNLIGHKEAMPVANGAITSSLPESINPAPPQGNSLSKGLKITPGSLQRTQFVARTDTGGEVVSLDYGRVPPGYSQLSGDILRLRNLTERKLKLTATLSGGMLRFCRNLQLTITSWTMERKLQGNPLILHHGEEARLEISLSVPFSTKNLGSYQGDLVISANNGAILKHIQLFITISNPEISA